MTTKLQPPVGTVIETREEAITIKAGEMSWEEWKPHLNRMLPRDLDEITRPSIAVRSTDGCLELADFFRGTFFPITFKQPFTYTPVYPAKVSEGIDDLEALADEPLKHYVWLEGMQLPSKAHDTREDAVKEALRLSPKERKRAFVITDVIVPVYRAEIVELEKG
jgi:hypothetical protein